MISLYSGTPGSGKSLHVAKTMYWWIRAGKPCICNFPIATEKIKLSRQQDFHFVREDKLTPDYLIKFAQDYIKKNGKVKEGSILLVIDECQRIFNARDWGQKGRADWLTFFTLHRHLGFDIILIAQFDRMLDRQIRALIEYEYIHRKVSNFGWKGKILSLLAFGNLFVSVKIWYPMKEKTGSEWYRAKKMYYGLYDTFAMFDGLGQAEDGGKGDPADAKTSPGTQPT